MARALRDLDGLGSTVQVAREIPIVSSQRAVIERGERRLQLGADAVLQLVNQHRHVMTLACLLGADHGHHHVLAGCVLTRQIVVAARTDRLDRHVSALAGRARSVGTAVAGQEDTRQDERRVLPLIVAKGLVGLWQTPARIEAGASESQVPGGKRLEAVRTYKRSKRIQR